MDMSIGYCVGCHIRFQESILGLLCFCSLNTDDVCKFLPKIDKATWLFDFL